MNPADSHQPKSQGHAFDNRVAAGKELADALQHYAGRDVLVLGIPRGGVPVAYEVARALDADLDVIVARKLGAPGHEEFAIGAVASDGTFWLNGEVLKHVAVSEEYLQRVGREQSAEAVRRERRFRAGMPPLDVRGRIVIVVDDGLATGATMRAALKSIEQRGALKRVVAIPVGAPGTCKQIARDVDELVCLLQPYPFHAVGQHYRVFDQTSDDEVEHLLRTRRQARQGASANLRG